MIGIRTKLVAIVVSASAIAACTGGLSSASDSAGLVSPPASATPEARPNPTEFSTPTASPIANQPPPRPDLQIDGLARVVANGVYVRRTPGLGGEILRPCLADEPRPCAALQLGAADEEQVVYVVEGPVEVDGYWWYQIATDGRGQALSPTYLGWVAAGDADGPWLVRHEPDCPAEPIELANITDGRLSWRERLTCFVDREFVVTGWYPQPPGGRSDRCRLEDDERPFCTFGGIDIVRTVQAPWAGSGQQALGWLGDPDVTLRAPDIDSWIMLRGRFNHPRSSECVDGQILFVLDCRRTFIVSEISPAAPPV